MIEEHIIYEYIPRPLYAGERHEIARTDEEQMPLEQTKAYSLAMAYAFATGRHVAIDPWTDMEFQPTGRRVLGYRIGEELVCVECGLKRLDPNRAAVIDYVRSARMVSVCATNGERLACQDCGEKIFSPKPLFPQQRGARVVHRAAVDP